MWTIDTNDWRKTSTLQSIANQIISTQGRDIILMHDAPEANPNFQHPEASASRQNTVDALDGAITSLKQRGLRFMTLSEAIYHQNP
jgi:peptidoglycan/xylan/chitin deacetylase (PgdA/CDA1 family)